MCADGSIGTSTDCATRSMAQRVRARGGQLYQNVPSWLAGTSADNFGLRLTNFREITLLQ
jgi:hypothetical protein